jgi:hypothetical protein
MRSRSLGELLRLPVCLNGVRLGRPVDAVLDLEGRRAVGFDVLCGDEVRHFLPLAAARVGDEQIAVGSPLLLLDDADGFYRNHATRFRSLLGRRATSGEHEAGALTDLLVGPEGAIEHLILATEDGDRRLDFANGVALTPGRPGR